MDLEISGQYNDVADFLGSVKDVYPISAEGLYLGGTYVWELPCAGGVALRAGAYSWDGSYRSVPEDMASVARDGASGTDFFLGLGYRYEMTPRWSLQALFERFRLGDDDVDFISVGMAYRFAWTSGG